MVNTRTNNLVSKKEAIGMISTHLRRPDIPANVLVKLIALLGQLQGWEKEQSPPSKEKSLDELVAAVERKRKQAGK